MAGNDDLFRGFAMFQQGLSQYNGAKAIEQANTKVNELNQSLLDKDQKMQAMTGVQNDLAMRLSSAGWDASKIGAATQNLAPSMGAQFQADENEHLQANTQSFQSSESAKQRAHELAMQRMKIDQMGMGDPKKEAKVLAGFAKDFRKENKDILDARDKMSSLSGILDKTPDRVGVEMAKTGLLKFAGEDRVSDADVARAQRDPSLRANIARKLKLEVTGEALADDRKFYQSILSHADKMMTKNLHKKVKGYSEGTAALAGIDGSQLEAGLKKQLNLSDDDLKSGAQVKMQKYEAWLNSPDAKTPSNAAKRQKVLEALTKLKQGI